jgi:hypothetical protein
MNEDTELRLMDEAIAHRCMQVIAENHSEATRQFIADCRMSATQVERLLNLISSIVLDAFAQGMDADYEILQDQLRRDGK